MHHMRQVPNMGRKGRVSSDYAAPVASEAGLKFGALVKAHRERRGLRWQDVVDQSGVSQSTVARWERGDVQNPKPAELRAVCKILGIPPARACLALGYLTVEDIDNPGEDEDPQAAEIAAFFADPAMSMSARESVISYMRWIREQQRQRQPGIDS